MSNVQKFRATLTEEVKLVARCDYCGQEHKLTVEMFLEEGHLLGRITVDDHSAIFYAPTYSIIE